MELGRLQAAIARLATNQALRERFIASPGSSAGDLGLTAPEAVDLARSGAQIAAFAESLGRKRLGAARKLLFLSSSALGSRFDDLFRIWAAGQPARDYVDEAIAFALHSAGESPAFRYEAALLSARRRRGLARWLTRVKAAWFYRRLASAPVWRSR